MEEYKEKYKIYLKNKKYIEEHDYLLSGEAMGYYGFPHGKYSFIVIPGGFKKLEFKERELKLIKLYILEGKTKKEICLELNVTNSWINGVYRSICTKLDDIWTSIYWSERVLDDAEHIYAHSLKNFGFSERIIYHLVRRSDVTTIEEFLAKPFDHYKRKFNKGTKMYQEIEDNYNRLKEGLNAVSTQTPPQQAHTETKDQKPV